MLREALRRGGIKADVRNAAQACPEHPSCIALGALQLVCVEWHLVSPAGFDAWMCGAASLCQLSIMRPPPAGGGRCLPGLGVPALLQAGQRGSHRPPAGWLPQLGACLHGQQVGGQGGALARVRWHGAQLGRAPTPAGWWALPPSCCFRLRLECEQSELASSVSERCSELPVNTCHAALAGSALRACKPLPTWQPTSGWVGGLHHGR